MYKIVCDGPTGFNCHVYNEEGEEVKCLAADISIRPGQATIAALMVLVDSIDIQIDENNVSTEERTIQDQISAQKSKGKE